MSEQNAEVGFMNSTVAVKNENKTVMLDPLDPTHEKVDDDNTDAPANGTDWKKRYDDLRRYQNKQAEEFKAKEAELAEQLASATPKYAPPKSAEELEEFKKTNPDIYDVAETVAHMRVSDELKTVQDELKKMKSVKEKVSRQTALAELKSLHPDFEEIRTDPVFKDWAKNQPSQIQNWLFKEQNATLTAKAIDLFKLAHTKTPDKASPKSDVDIANVVNTKSAVDPSPTGEKTWTHTQINNMSVKEFEKNKDAIDKAFVEGRLIPK